MKQVPLFLNQNPLDVALQEYGAAEAVWDLIADNPSVLSLETPFAAAGTKLAIRENLSTNPNASLLDVELYRSRKHKPATGAKIPCGIGYMIIEQTFIVVDGDCEHCPSPCEGIVAPVNDGISFWEVNNDFEVQ